jgi:nucleoid DNA-binding protein
MAKEASSSKKAGKSKAKAPARGAKATPAKKPAEKGGGRRTGAITEGMTKAQLHTAIAEVVGLPKAQVDAVFDELVAIVGRHLSARGVGQFTLSGLLKITRAKKPATKARVGRNPRTGETIQIAAKPARTVVRIRALKGLKEML